jgi:phosphoenolpyruvate-protein phosphotransferase
MEILIGRPVSPGYAEGTAVLFNTDGILDVPKRKIHLTEVEDELGRFERAVARSSADLQDLERRVTSDLGNSHSSIFSAHLALLHDKDFAERVSGRIRHDLINAEQAVDLTVSELAARIQALDNPYLQERARDVRDIGQRLMTQLVYVGVRQFARLESEAVVIARELLPSETIDLDRQHVVAIITEEGGENSHAAILARALNIPAVTGVIGATSRIAPGTRLLVDGESGRITLTPTDSASGDFRMQSQEFAETASAAIRDECHQCITRDGTIVGLSANINRPAETLLVAAHHLNGVGLFRTEFMFMDSPEPPDFERQVAVYRDVIAALQGCPLVIRTLDFGGDKVPRFMAADHEANPTLGARGLRFSLAHPDLFDTQLRAIVAACDKSAAHNVRILFPMVLGESDLQLAVDRFRATAKQLGSKYFPTIGAMIETPSALFALDQILEIAEFVSIGSNDLVQFMLAADRHAVDFAGEFSLLHPSVLRAIRSVVEACNSAGRELSVCGEAAGDPATACLLVGLGVRHLSMSPGRAARVRLAIRHHRYDELQRVADKALSASATEYVRQLLFAALRIADKERAGIDPPLLPIRKVTYAAQHGRR